MFGIFNGILNSLNNNEITALINALGGLPLTTGGISKIPTFVSSKTVIKTIKAEIPQLLLDPPQEGENRRILITTSTDSDLNVRITPKPKLNETDVSEIQKGKTIPGGWMYDDEQIGGYLWGFCQSDCQITITIESNLITAQEENMPLEMGLALPTGNVDMSWTDVISWNYLHDNRPFLSTDDKSGHKLFYFNRFTPGKTYDFTLSGVNYDLDNRQFPINIYLFDMESIFKAAAWFSTWDNPFSGFAQPTDKSPTTVQSLLKKKSWVAGFKKSGGNFSMTPTHSRYIGCIDIAKFTYTEQPADGAVFTYTPYEIGEGGTFNILGC